MAYKSSHIGLKDILAAQSTGKSAGIHFLVAIVLAIWLALVFVLGARGDFVRPPNSPPLPIFLGAAVPIVVFLIAYFASSAFRTFVLASDVRLGAAIQAWRVGGLGFLALYVHGILPGSFALPAGLGDIAIGVTAPWMVLAIIRRPEFAASRMFVIWNLLGILDLVVAVGSGGLSSWFSGGVPMIPMSQLPLVLIPAYFVPIFVMLHLAALFQARKRG